MSTDLPAWLPDTVGIVLAGGRSRRFGTDKLRHELGGRPLLHHPIEALATVADRLVVVVPPGDEPQLPESLAGRISVAHDPEAHGGPLLGVATGLRVAAQLSGHSALVVGGDMPSLVPAVLRRLVVALGDGRLAVTLEVPGRVQPLPLALEVTLARVAAERLLATGERSLRSLVAELGAATVPAPVWLALDPGAATIVDIDRPTDLPA
jgi:molybdopterin-guanine dinucleotide biosynthesis protein A